MLKRPDGMRQSATQQEIARHMILHRRDKTASLTNTFKQVNVGGVQSFQYPEYMEYKALILGTKEITVRDDNVIEGPAVGYDEKYFQPLDAAYNALLANKSTDKKVIKKLLQAADTALNNIPKKDKPTDPKIGFHGQFTNKARDAVRTPSLLKTFINAVGALFQNKKSSSKGETPLSKTPLASAPAPAQKEKPTPKITPDTHAGILASTQSIAERVKAANIAYKDLPEKNEAQSKVKFDLNTAERVYTPELKSIIQLGSITNNTDPTVTARPGSLQEINAQWDKEVSIKNKNVDEPSRLALREKSVKFEESLQHEYKYDPEEAITRSNFKAATNTLVKDAYLDSHGLSAVTNEPENRHDLEQEQENTISPTLYS